MIEPVGYLYFNVTNERLAIINRRWAALCAMFIVRQFQKVIEEQRYRGDWAPLTRPYLAYKRRQGLSLNTWEATGYLKNAITTYWDSSRGAFVCGIRPRYRHPGRRGAVITSTQRGRPRRRFRIMMGPSDGWFTLKIARVLEYGSRTKNIPARRLFSRVVEEFTDVAERIGIRV